MEQEYKYMVCIRCFTFNHAPYIVETMNGFTMQETTFPVVTLIVDDASTDGEQDVIRKYIEDNFNRPYRADETEYAYIICAKHKKNPYCEFVVFLLKYNHWGKKDKTPYLKEWMDNAKYYALCEGDDYWTYPGKLQSQVTYLEEHPNIVLSCHRFKEFDQDTATFSSDGHDNIFKSSEDGFVFSYQQKVGWLTKTLTLVYRSCYYADYLKIGSGLDSVFIYSLMKHGDAYIHNKVWGVYRKHEGGIYSKNTFVNNVKRAYKAFKTLYNYDPNVTTRRMYYDCYATMFYVSRGKILLEEKFELRKFLSLGYYYTLKIYRFLFNKRT